MHSGRKEPVVRSIESVIKDLKRIRDFTGKIYLCYENDRLYIKNLFKEIKSEEFFCPGSILSIQVDNSHPIAYGMPGKVGAFFARSPAFKVIPSFNVEANVIAMYPGRNPLMSGWILGEKALFNKAAVVEIPVKKGRAITT